MYHPCTTPRTPHVPPRYPPCTSPALQPAAPPTLTRCACMCLLCCLPAGAHALAAAAAHVSSGSSGLNLGPLPLSCPPRGSSSGGDGSSSGGGGGRSCGSAPVTGRYSRPILGALGVPSSSPRPSPACGSSSGSSAVLVGARHACMMHVAVVVLECVE